MTLIISISFFSSMMAVLRLFSLCFDLPHIPKVQFMPFHLTAVRIFFLVGGNPIRGIHPQRPSLPPLMDKLEHLFRARQGFCYYDYGDAEEIGLPEPNRKKKLGLRAMKFR